MGANAQTSVPAFTSGQVLTAAQMTQVNTGIPVFADSTARDAAFGGTGEKTLAEGQMAYLEDTNATQYYDGSAWTAIAGGKILQVLSTTKTDTFSTSSASYTDITGLSVTITPTSATSKVFVSFTINISSSTTSTHAFVLVRDSTEIAIGTAAGSREQATTSNIVGGSDYRHTAQSQYLDSPATTSATTYKVQVMAGGSVVVNKSNSDTDTSGPLHARTTSTITAMEVSA